MGGLAGGGLLALVGRLAQLQLVEAQRYQKLSGGNQFNYRLVSPPRGAISDRNGEPDGHGKRRRTKPDQAGRGMACDASRACWRSCGPLGFKVCASLDHEQGQVHALNQIGALDVVCD